MSVVTTALVGPAQGDLAKLESALRWLLFDQATQAIFYFGDKDEAARCLENIASDIGSPPSLLASANQLALSEDKAQSAMAISELLDRVRHTRRLAAVHVVPEVPRKHVELVRNRLMLLTRDHKHLAEDDIANATLIVYANNKQSVFKRFGKRAFFAPPPLAQNAVGIVRARGPVVDLIITTVSGETTWTESILAPKTKMTVST